MGKYAQLVMGPAGCGKSTYCQHMMKHCATVKRSVHIVNLDPAAEDLRYEPSIDIRELVRVEEVMEANGFGPNGALVFCMEYLVENIDWLEDELQDFEEDYLIVDCPGQVELYSHLPVMHMIADCLQKAGYSVVGLYLIDSHFVSDATKFISGVLAALSAMARLEIPHISLMTKMDLIVGAAPEEGSPGAEEATAKKNLPKATGLLGSEREDTLESFLDVDIPFLLNRLERDTGPKFAALNKAVGQMLEDYSMIKFLPLNLTDSESVEAILAQCDYVTQYDENEEPRDAPDRDDQGEDADHSPSDEFPDYDESGDAGDGTGFMEQND